MNRNVAVMVNLGFVMSLCAQQHSGNNFGSLFSSPGGVQFSMNFPQVQSFITSLKNHPDYDESESFDFEQPTATFDQPHDAFSGEHFPGDPFSAGNRQHSQSQFQTVKQFQHQQHQQQQRLQQIHQKFQQPGQLGSQQSNTDWFQQIQAQQSKLSNIFHQPQPSRQDQQFTEPPVTAAPTPQRNVVQPTNAEKSFAPLIAIGAADPPPVANATDEKCRDCCVKNQDPCEKCCEGKLLLSAAALKTITG